MWTTIIASAGQLIGGLIGRGRSNTPTYETPESDNTGMYVTISAAIIFMIIIFLILRKK